MGQDQLDKFFKQQLESHRSSIDPDLLWSQIQDKTQASLEDEIQNKLFNHEVNINSSSVWKSIKGEVQPKPLFGKLSLGALFVLGLIATFLIIREDKTEADINGHNWELNLKSSEAAEITSNDIAVHSAASNDPIIANDNIDEEAIISNVKDITTEKQNRNVTLSKLDNKSVNQEKSNSVTNSKTDDRPNNIDVSKTSEVNKGSLDFTVNKSSQNSSSSFPSNIGDSKENTSITKEASSKAISMLSAIDNRYTNSIGLDLTTAPQIEFPILRSKRISIECYDHTGRKFHSFLVGFTSLDYYNKSMQLETQMETDYLSERKRTQNYQLSNRSGLQFKLLHKKGFYVKAGAELGLMREKFRHETRDTTTEILPNQLLNIDINSNGDTTYTYGNAPVTTISTLRWNVNNKLITIGIPVSVGYQKQLSGFQLAFEAGVLYNINHSFSGWLMGPTNDPVDARNYFIKNNDLNLTGGVNLIYELSPRFNGFLLASFKRNLNSINQVSENFVDQKNTTFGVGIGIEMKI